jgi:hypothetical protein
VRARRGRGKEWGEEAASGGNGRGSHESVGRSGPGPSGTSDALEGA